MLFKEVMDNLIQGKCMSRAAWEQTGEYICLMPGMQTIWKILIQPNPNAGNWLPFVVDFLADDWKIMERARALCPAGDPTPSPDAPQSA